MYLLTALDAEKEIILYSLCSHINSVCSVMKLGAKMQAGGHLQKGAPASPLSDPLAHFTKNLVLARFYRSPASSQNTENFLQQPKAV